MTKWSPLCSGFARLAVATSLIGITGAACSVAAAADVDRDAPNFTRDVAPILASRCYACHGPDQAESGLDLTARDTSVHELESGEFAIVAGDADAGTLIDRVTSTDEFERMPSEGEPLSDEEVDILRRWIDAGAKYESHWAFEPIGDPVPPQVDDPGGDQVTSFVDAFVVSNLRDGGLDLAPPVGRRQWLRRVTYDLTGLPPTTDELRRYESDDSPTAHVRVIDRLLASPDYGARWGRHWLDVVRYAETNSFERDGPKPNAHRYRDYVVDALNADKPYDQFVREQIAGDELDTVTAETLAATGYYRLGLWDDEPADPLQAKFDGYDDLVATTGAAFLGLTINCARCHDHKIDPIPQKDYYAMVAFVADVTPYATRRDTTTNNQIDVSPPELKRRYIECERRRNHLRDSMRTIEQTGIAKMSAPDQRATEGPPRERRRVLNEKLRDHLDAPQWARYQGLKEQLRDAEDALKNLPPRTRVLGLARTIPNPEPTFVLYRGNPASPTDSVEPAFPDIFNTPPPTIPPNDGPTSGRRRVLADWVTSPDNFLTPRVIVNRIFQHHFGRGIVRSPNNFGRMGSPPTHPDLLDYMARRIAANGWSIKRMHRGILSSATYRQSSEHPESDRYRAIDPTNDQLWHFGRRRLSAEELRDSMLMVSGRLNRQLGGPSVYPELSPEVLAGQSRPGEGWHVSSIDQQCRRSIHIHVKRSLIEPMLSAFDFPDPDVSCDARFQTLGPNQSLALLNSDFAISSASALVDSLDLPAEADKVTAAMLANAVIGRVLRRSATAAEIKDADRLITSLIERGLDREQAHRWYALSVMNWNEFIFLQ